MSRILVVGEDALCCALGEKLVTDCLPDWQLSARPIDTKGITKLIPALARYQEQAQHVQPVLCIADTDRKCAVELLAAWLPRPRPEHLLLRLAVTEAESWLLADRGGFATAFQVPLNKLPQNPDEVDDPKRTLLTLARRSKQRLIRDEVVSAIDPSKQGSGYNTHLRHFVLNHWDAHRAAQTSQSLARAMSRLAELKT